MAKLRTLFTLGTCVLVLMFATGDGCSFFEDIAGPGGDKTGDGPGNDDNGTTDDSSDDETPGDTDSGPTITVQFVISAKVVTSIGSGVDGETVNFVANKYYWNDYEEEWEFRRTASASRTTNSAGEPGTTDPWLFGYDLHKNETVFISATEQGTGHKQEITYTYAQATAAAGSGTTASHAYRFTLDSGI